MYIPGPTNKKGGRGKAAAEKSAAFVTSDEDEEEVEGIVEPNGVLSQSTIPRARPAYRKEPSENGADTDGSQLTQLTEDERTPDPQEPDSSINGVDASPDASPFPMQSTPPATGKSTAPLAKKRARSADAETDTAIEAAEADHAGSASPGTAQVDEIIVRRKRVRH